MIEYAKQLNLQFSKTARRKAQLSKKINQRKKIIILAKYGEDRRQVPELFDDPVLIYLYLVKNYYMRVERRSVKTMTIKVPRRYFEQTDNLVRDEIWAKLIEQFAKHQIVMRVKENPHEYSIALTTSELF